MTTLLTLALDANTQEHFESLRREHYPPALNRIPAHLSLFHQLPGTSEVADRLQEMAAATPAFPLRITGVRSLGRGVAYKLEAPELAKLHAALSRSFEPHLIPQDRQRFSPHIVVQNKAVPGEAAELLAALQAHFVPRMAEATGLLWWEYLGGPWRLLQEYRFEGRTPEATTPG